MQCGRRLISGRLNGGRRRIGQGGRTRGGPPPAEQRILQGDCCWLHPALPPGARPQQVRCEHDGPCTPRGRLLETRAGGYRRATKGGPPVSFQGGRRLWCMVLGGLPAVVHDMWQEKGSR
jgi:hypothetical protein